MDFAELKKKALEAKDKLVETSTKKMVASSMVINTPEQLEAFIKKSETKTITSKETGEEKTCVKKVIILFAEKDSDFLKKALLQFGVFYAKAFSQNIPFKMCDLDLKEIKKYKVKSIPSLVVFETEKAIKFIEWEENIGKVVKDLSLDIMKAIDKQ